MTPRNRDEVLAAVKYMGSWAACLFGLAIGLRLLGVTA